MENDQTQSLTLYGSLTSPYVRRIRMYMENMDYHFEQTNIFDNDNRARFAELSPIKKLPVLVDSGNPIFDSHIIYQHLRQKQGLPFATIEECNLVSVIDALTDSNIILLMSQRSGLDTNDDRLIFQLQRERIPACLKWLEKQAESGAFNDWHFATMCLVSSLDWLLFRDLVDISGYDALNAVLREYADLDIVQSTQPVQ